MTTKVSRPPMTAARFLSLSGTDGYELVDGRAREKTMGGEASWIQHRLSMRVGSHVESGGHGHVFGADCMFHCFPHKREQVRKPDLSFIRVGRLPGEVPPKGPITLPPDLTAEVVSPKERADDLTDKVEDFIRAGVPLIWVLNPGPRTVVVHTGRVSKTLTADDELTGDPVLPGFRVKVADLFPPAPPPA